MKLSHTKKTFAGDLHLVPGLGMINLDAVVLPEALARKVEVELELFTTRMQEGLMAAALGIGLEVFSELLQTEVTEKAGKKGKHNSNRTAKGHGTEPAKLPLGGRMVRVGKPRVRSADGSKEIPLETWEAVASRDLLERHTIISMLSGVSTRNYETVLEPVGSEVEARESSTSRSAV